MEEYIVTQIHLPSATGCNHVHIHFNDGSMVAYHMSDFTGEKTIQNDPVYDFLYAKVKELRLKSKSEIKTALTGIKIYK